MASAYTPTDFFRGDRTKTAKSWSEHWQLIYDGWKIDGPTPQPPRNQVPAHLSDVDDAVDITKNASLKSALNSEFVAFESDGLDGIILYANGVPL